jgi:iron complex outermembrane receptor protein
MNNFLARLSKVLIVFLSFISFNTAGNGYADISRRQSDNLMGDSITRFSGQNDSLPDAYIGSWYFVTAADFNNGLILRPEELFQGRIPGLNSFPADGMPGTPCNMSFRSGSTISNNNPLILIDEFPVSDGKFVINPADILEVSFLSGGLAVSLYGSEAAQGVVRIRTMQKTNKFKLTYKSTAGISVLPRKTDVFNATEFKSLIEPYFTQYPGLQSQIGNASTDWQDEITRAAAGQDHYLSVSGVNFNVPWKASAGYNSTNGIVETTGYKRFTTSLQVRPEFFKKHLSAKAGIFYNNANAVYDDWNAFSKSKYFDPTLPVTENNDFGNYFFYKDDYGNPLPYMPINPVARLRQVDPENLNNELIANYSIEYKLHFLPALKLGVKGNYWQSDIEKSVKANANAAWYNNLRAGDVNVKHEIKTAEKFIEPYVAYNHYFANSGFGVGFQAGYRSITRANDYSITSLLSESDEGYISENDAYKDAYYSMLNINYLNRYSLTLSLLNEKSSIFSDEQRKSLSPGIGLLWDIKQETFLRNISFLGKLEAYVSYNKLHPSNINYNTFPNLMYAGNLSYGELLLDNDLHPETTTQLETGLHFYLPGLRTRGGVTFFSNNHEDLMVILPIASGDNFNNYILVNGPAVQSRGFDLHLSSLVLTKNKLSLEAGLNLSVIKQTVTSLISGLDYMTHGFISTGVGNYVQVLKEGSAPGSFFVFSQLYDANGHPVEGMFTNFSGGPDPVYGNNENRYIYGKADPDLLASLYLQVKYSNLRLGISARMNTGQSVYNQAAALSYYDAVIGVIGTHASNIPKFVENSGFQKAWFLSDHYIENASFLRIDNISLSYTFNQIAGGKSCLEIEAAVQNAMLFSGYSGIDPETNKGIDYLQYPRPRIFSLSLKFGI